MVRTFITKISAPVRGLHQAAYLLAALTLASQALALLRDRIFAHVFGAGHVLDMYYAAFKIPDLVYALVVSLVSAYVLIPKIAALLKGGDQAAARRLMSETASFLLIGGGIFCGLLAVLAPKFLFLLFPEFNTPAYASQFVFLARILLMQPILLGLSSILSSVTQLERRFFLFALSPVLYNAGIIFGTLVLYPYFGVLGIGIGVLAGAFVHQAIHVPVVWKARLAPRLIIPRPRELWLVFRDSVPRSMALAMSSLTTLLLIALASRQGEGGVAVFTLASNLEAVPLSLIGAAYATAAFPVLAEQAGAAKYDAFKQTVTAAARHIIFWSSVIMVLTVVLRAHIVRIILGSGAFNWNNTRLTAAILAVLVIGLLAQGLILLCARAFYAAGRSWNPLIVQLADCGISVAVAYGLVHMARVYPMVRYFMEAMLRIPDIPGSSVLFIAVGATVGQLLMGAAAMATLRVVAPGVARSLFRPLFDGLGAAILGGAAAYGTLSFMGALAPLTHLAIVFAEGLIAGIVGISVAGAVLALLENQEFKELVASLRKITSLKPLPSYAPVTIHDGSDS